MPNAILFSIKNDNGSSSPSCEICGWLWTIGAILAFGSFGVPVKSKAAKSVDVDPLVMQTYKTGMCFVTSCLFLLCQEEKIMFTPWGIVSGLFWVPGGIAMIYAIQTAGLAIGMGVGTSFIALVSFSWGIFFFDEHVHSRIQACFAVVCMLCGLAGMAYYSAPTAAHATSSDYAQLENCPDADDDNIGMDYHPMEHAAVPNRTENKHNDGSEDDKNSTTDSIGNYSENHSPDNATTEESQRTSILICGIMVQERVLGILAAFFVTGLWGGSMMVPMQFAPKMDKGLPFLTSFSVGATLVTFFFWFVRYLFLCHKHNYSFISAYIALPSFHFKKIWPYGTACGVLWSIGNFCSILSVKNLGEGVGYSATQASMLVSGLWGIFYFREIEGVNAVSKWFTAASVTVIGILFLSYEHHKP
mmetsp:Transcript_8241/g.12672  ORF Transcript_8241/g.12672 Transcript_8241/m.12672 type:complete len:416 (+) Transcript_8241:132-1379(+)